MPASLALDAGLAALTSEALRHACGPGAASVQTAEGTPGSIPGVLHPDEARLLARVSEKRRRELRAGRLLAREALTRLGFAPSPLLSGANREPLWPQGAIGSITHTDGYCGVVVARRGALAGVGIDAEPDVALDRDLWEIVCTDAELRWLRSLADEDGGRAAKLIFSAKEAGFKAQFPLTRSYLEFREAEVNVDLQGSAFDVRFLTRAGCIAEGSVFRGAFTRRAGLVLTAIALASSEDLERGANGLRP